MPARAIVLDVDEIRLLPMLAAKLDECRRWP